MESILSNIPYYICAILSFVPAIVFHEVAHGFAAYKLGDPTAKSKGRLSLNPLRHVDPFGTVIMPLLLMIMNGPIFGYAKPVPYNPMYFKNPRRDDLIVGMAGPLTNIVLAFIAVGLSWVVVLTYSIPTVASFLSTGFGSYFVFLYLPLFVLINLFFAFFNLIPIPPLDGSSIFAAILPRKYLPQYYKIQHYALPIFLIVVIGLPYLLNIDPIGAYLNWTAYGIYNLVMPF